MMRGAALLLLVAAVVALGMVPILAPPYYANLLVPFFGYAIALLGFNLLFGYAGLLSFGHAMFLGLGAYGAAVIAGVLGIRQFEIVLIGVALAGLIAALPIGFLCVRYTGIFFGMLTLAFGMLAHSVLFKFYHLTGGDSGMRIPRMRILGLEFAAYNKIELLAGPFYYYCLALLVIAGFIMWRIVHSPFGLHLRALRDNAQKAEYLGVRVRQFRLAAFAISAVYGADRRRHSGLSHRPCRPGARSLDALGSPRVHDRAGGILQLPRAHRRRAGADAAAGPAAVDTQYWRFVLGAILAAVVIFFPRGLAGIAADLGAARYGQAKAGGRRMTPLIETRGVSKHYGAFRALDDVSVAVGEGEFVSVVGPNGAGKTTLVNLLTGLLAPTKGEVYFRGREHRRRGPGGAGRARHGPHLPARADLPAADRGRDHRRRRRVPARQAVAAVLGVSEDAAVRPACRRSPASSAWSTGCRAPRACSRRARRSCWTSPPPSRWRPR